MLTAVDVIDPHRLLAEHAGNTCEIRKAWEVGRDGAARRVDEAGVGTDAGLGRGVIIFHAGSGFSLKFGLVRRTYDFRRPAKDAKAQIKFPLLMGKVNSCLMTFFPDFLLHVSRPTCPGKDARSEHNGQLNGS